MTIYGGALRQSGHLDGSHHQCKIAQSVTRRSLKMSSRNRALKYGETKTTSLVSPQLSAFYILVALSNRRPQTLQCQLEAKTLRRRDNRHCPVHTLIHAPHLIVGRFASEFQQASSAWLGTETTVGRRLYHQLQTKLCLYRRDMIRYERPFQDEVVATRMRTDCDVADCSQLWRWFSDDVKRDVIQRMYEFVRLAELGLCGTM
jgi:hypothetical protein